MTTPQNNDLIGSMRKNNRAARAARTLVKFFDVGCEGFNDNVNVQQCIFHSLYLL